LNQKLIDEREPMDEIEGLRTDDRTERPRRKQYVARLTFKARR
jgi:hypothetical protein